MHDQHDDPLERELARLSQYTGEPTSIWRDAIDNHRRRQQQKVWVWVRRPAPALAAACLALLVAAVSLRPVGPASPASGRESATGRAEFDSVMRKAGAANATPTATDPSSNQLPRDITQNTKGLENFTARNNDRQDERYARTAGSNAAEPAPTGILTGGSPGTGDPGRTESGSNLASRGGVNAPGYGAGGGGGSAGTKNKADDNAGQAGGTPPPAPVVAAAPAQPAPAQPAPVQPAPAKPDAAPLSEKLAAKSEGKNTPAAPGADAAAANVSPEPIEQSATVRLAVADINSFYYKQVPSLVDLESGESITNQQVLAGPAGEFKDAPSGANLTLRVSEARLPAVLAELRKSGVVQEETTQLVPKEYRLKQIDALVAENELALKLAAAEKEKSDSAAASRKTAAAPGGKGPPATPPTANDGDQAKTRESIDALNRRRLQIEQGRDLATLNIVAIPDVPPPPAPMAIAPPPSMAPAGTPAPSSTRATTEASDKRLAADSPAPGAAPAPNSGLDGDASRAKDQAPAAPVDARVGVRPVYYWAPALAALLGGFWWWRRAASASEPPPV